MNRNTLIRQPGSRIKDDGRKGNIKTGEGTGFRLRDNARELKLNKTLKTKTGSFESKMNRYQI